MGAVDVFIRASVRMLIPAGKRREALEILSLMMKRITRQEECLSCRLYQDVISEDWLLFEEIWSSEKAFQKHLRSHELRTVLLAVEMAIEPPEFRFENLARLTGIDIIEDLSR